LLINNPDADIILRRGANLLRGGVSFAGSQSLTMRDLNLTNSAENSSITALPTNFRNLTLTLENSNINLSNTALTGSLELTGRDIVIDQDVSAIAASLRGDNITINRNFTTTDSKFLGYSLGINSNGTFRIRPTSNINVAGEFFDSGTGDNAIAGNITARSVFFNRPVNLVGDTKIFSDNAIRFVSSVNGGFALNLDANGNQISMSQFGNSTALSALTVAPSSILIPYSRYSELTSDKDNININVLGNISLGSVTNDQDSSISINSSQGSIKIGDINSAAITTGNAGNVTVRALQNITTGNINASAIAGAGGNVELASSEGSISTGDVNTSSSKGGEIFYNASTAINAGRINSSGTRDRAGNVTLDPVGDVVVRSIDAAGVTQGGNVTLVSTGGNLRITDTLLSSNNSACVGASICTVGGTGGVITLQTGGLGSFFVGDATLNGAAGFFTTGLTTVNIGTVIPVLLGSSFTQGGISVTPGGFLTNPPVDRGTIDSKAGSTFIPIPKAEVQFPKDPVDDRILAIRDIFKKEADRYFREGNLAKAFDAIEQAYVAELEIFTGQSLGKEAINIENTQDLLSTVAQQRGDVAALIYPVLFDDRIEILVIPPKDKGKPFSRTTVAANQQTIQDVITDYRNNLRDVGSNDYLEQSQQLYDWIIRPIEKQLSDLKINTLVFAMDSGLRVTPPAALHDGKQFLIERYAIANIPALRATRIEERNRKATRVLAMGLTESVQGFSALPSVDIEIKTISGDLLKGNAFLNKEFTVNNLQNQRQQGVYNILHLGTHAQFVSDTNKDSFIQFWDSRLQLSQIPKLRFDDPVIDMLTLSACQTAVGNNLGISGLAVESGARSVLASLWEVSDAGTAPLMISFYKAFPDADNKAQAMRQAQLSLLSGKVLIDQGKILGIEGFPDIPLPAGLGLIDLRHPFYWSSFILVGNWL
jgi:CHAT domain-containing protein